jgi:hypothetical protein
MPTRAGLRTRRQAVARPAAAPATRAAYQAGTQQAQDFLRQFFAEAHASLGDYAQAEQSVRAYPRRTQLAPTLGCASHAPYWRRIGLPEATRIVRLAHEVALKANLDGYFIVDTLLDYEQYDMLAKLLTPANWSRLQGCQARILTRLIEKGQWQLAASYAPRIESAHEREQAYLSLALARARANDLDKHRRSYRGLRRRWDAFGATGRL